MKPKLLGAAAALMLVLASCAAAPQTAPAGPTGSASSRTPAPSDPQEPWLAVGQAHYELPGESAVEIAYTLHNEDGLGNEVEPPALAWRDENGDWMAVDARDGFCGVPDPLGDTLEGTLQLNQLFVLPGDGEYRLTFCVLGPDDYRHVAADTFTLTLTSCVE